MVGGMLTRMLAYLLAVCVMAAGSLAGLAPRGALADGLAAGEGAVVIADALNLRGGPGVENPVVGVLMSGTALQLLAGPVRGDWWRVTDGSRAGFVQGAWLAPGALPGELAAFDLDLDLPFHRQETAVWCDPADLQSWIEYDLGASLGASFGVQQSIWEWELDHNAGFTLEEWNASPYAVASAAHQWLPDRGFNHFMYDDPVLATATVAWLLANPQYREPAVALIWAADHYVLVRGVRATADPFLSYPDAEILGVYVMDPNQGSASWLGEDRYIPLADWMGGYLTPVTYLTPHSGVPGDAWQGRYVMIQRDWENGEPTLDGRLNAGPESYAAGR